MLRLHCAVDPMHSLCSAPSHSLRFRTARVNASFFNNRSNLMRPSLQSDRSSLVFSNGSVPAIASSSCSRTEGEGESSANSGAMEIAVLDMAAYFSDEAGARAGFVENLRDQCHTAGLFYVKNHGVSQELCDKMLATARHFFDLPASVKRIFKTFPMVYYTPHLMNKILAIARQFFDLPANVKNEMDYTASSQFRGYMKIGVENTAGLVDFREQIEFGPEENAEANNSDGNGGKAIHPVFWRLRGPNQWPPATLLPAFRSTAMEFMEQVNAFSMHLMQAVALSLGLDHDYFDSTFRPAPHYQMKIARYPPKPSAEDGDAGVGMFGVGPHSDTGFLSLLLQDNIGGLQAQIWDGKWIDVPPVEGTLLVNLGEMLQLATHGYYLATVHRVLSRPGTQSRYSIPFFFNPCLDAEVKPMDIQSSQSITTTSSGGGESTTHGGKNKLHPVFGINTFKSFARSHPQVVKRHHPDLVVDAQGNLVLE